MPALLPLSARKTLRVLRRLAPVAAFCLCLAGVSAQTPGQVVEPDGANPVNAVSAAPSARELIDTWRAANKFLPDKHVDRERFLILDRRVAPGKFSRAFLQFRILPPQGDALAFAEARCPGRDSPIELQVFFQWSAYVNGWVAHGVKGDGLENLCGEKIKYWSPEQIESLLHPPALPVPPKISREDVFTPPVGSPERAAIIDALRPDYERIFGPPIQFKVVKLRMSSGFAFAVVHPQRPNGAPIEAAIWKSAMGEPCFQNRLGVEHEYWMRLLNGNWVVGVRNGMCSDDSIVGQGDLIGAPPQLVDMDAWPEREFPPALDE